MQAEYRAFKNLCGEIKRNPGMILSGLIRSPAVAIKASFKVVAIGLMGLIVALIVIETSQSLAGNSTPVSAVANIVGLAAMIGTYYLGWKWLFSGMVKRFGSVDTHGSARMATSSDIADLKKEVGLLIGREQKKKNLLRYSEDSHLLTIAPNRSGKGVGTIIPNLLTLDRPVICIDPKGENTAVTRRARAQFGPVHVLDPFGVIEGERSQYNPLDRIDPASPDVADDVNALADALVYDPPESTSDAHWNEEAKALISGLLLFIVSTQEPAQRNLLTLREYLTMSPEMFATTIGMMQNSPELAYGLVARAANRFVGKSDREASGVLSAAQRHTHFLDSPRMAHTLSASSFSFKDLKQGTASVFLVLPPEHLPTYNRWLRLLVTQSLRELSTGGKPQKRILYLLDEFAALGYLASIEQAMGLMAGYGIQLWPILQDMAQLKSIYKQRAGTFLSNAGVLQIFGVNDHETAQHVSNLMGQTTVQFDSISMSRGFDIDPGSQSEQRTGRALLTPDEVRMLPRDEQLLFVTGHPPIRATKLRYYEDSEFAGLFDQIDIIK